MLETITIFILACFLGMISGLLPGIGGFAIMIMAFPFLLHIDPINVLIFYVTLVSIDQYFNAISSILFAIPGSSTSAPTILEGHTLFRQGKGEEAILYSAITSWISSIFGITFVLLCIPLMPFVYAVWNTHIQATVFSFVIFGLIFFSNNKIFINLILFIIGNLLAYVGWSSVTHSAFLTFGLPELYTGLPLLPIMIALYIFPLLLNNTLAYNTQFNFEKLNFSSYFEAFKKLLRYKATICRSSILGALGGLVPGLTYGMSTVLAYNVEKLNEIRKKSYKIGNMKCLIASEGSNNAGVITQLIPFLFLGIPITGSEALIYDILETQRVILTIDWFQGTFSIIFFTFLISSTIGLFLAGKYVNFLSILNGISLTKIYLFIAALLLIVLFYSSVNTYMGIYQLILVACLLPFGYFLKSFDNMPLIFGFILHPLLYDIFYRISYLYL